MHRRDLILGGLAACAVGVSTQAPARSEVPVAEILRRRVDVEKRALGMAAAVVTHRGHDITCYGRLSLRTQDRVSGETLFEIGSITKIYTALLLAILAHDGVLGIDDPVAKHLPADLRLPQREGRAITLADLATHTGGFPRFPSTMKTMASFGVEDLKAWLADFDLPRVPGSGWEYSNVGYALLGLALSHRANRAFDELLKGRILDPLDLANTFLSPPKSVAARVADGHDENLNPRPPFDGGIFAAAGGLRASVEDVARFLDAVMPKSKSPIAPSAWLLLKTLRPAPAAGGQQALGWEVLPASEGDYGSKDGVTAGQCASAVFDLAGRMGVVVLSNAFPHFGKADTSPSGGGIGAADIARHLLRPSIALGS